MVKAIRNTALTSPLRWIFLFVLLWSAGPCGVLADEPLTAIRQTWGALRKALAAGDGRGAISLMTPGSVDYFRYVMNLALYAEKDELRVVPAYDAVWAIVLRGISTVEDLRDSRPDEFIGRVISNDQSMRTLFSQSELAVTNARVIGPKASVVVNDGRASTDGVRFELLDGRWLFDYTTISDFFSRYVSAERTRNGYSWEQTMSFALLKDPKKPLPERVFMPPLRRN